MIANKIASVDGTVSLPVLTDPHEYVMCVYDGDEWVREVCNPTLVNSPEELKMIIDHFLKSVRSRKEDGDGPQGAELRRGVDRLRSAWGLS